MPLNDITVRNAKARDKPYKISDANGLHLLIKVNGAKYWRLKYRFAGKEKLLALGVYPEVSLKEARDKRDAARKILQDGKDPSESKRQEKLKNSLNASNSLESIAREWHEQEQSKWTSRHSSYVLRRLEANIFKTLGLRPIHDISASELLGTLREIEKRGAIDIAHRTLQTCGQIFRYAIITDRAERDISIDLKGALKTRKTEHYARLEADEMGEFLTKLDTYDGDIQTQLALKLLVLTFVRTGELRGAKWEEIDFDRKTWRIPAERMKMRDPHIVPLSDQSLEIFSQLKLITGTKAHVFPNKQRPTGCMSENTMLYALYRMGYHSRTTGHGFRATASTVLNEHSFRPDVIERQLAHCERSKVRASYNHAQYLPERREMMQWWADYLDEMKGKCN